MRLRHIAFAGVTIAALTACATRPAVPTYVQVPVAVAGSCIPKELPQAPAVETPAQLAAITDGPTRYVHTAAAYLALFARSLQAEPVLTACR
jgi:hypothetical protein